MRTKKRQRGSTLIISLVFLLVFLVVALSIFRGSLTSSQAIGNMQWRNEAISAANETIDRLLSSPAIAMQPQLVVEQVNGLDNKSGILYDMNLDKTSDVIVNFPLVNGVRGPQCLRVRRSWATQGPVQVHHVCALPPNAQYGLRAVTRRRRIESDRGCD